MEEKKPDISQYLDDIQLIKKTLDGAQPKVYLEAWAFLVWGPLIILSTFLVVFLEKTMTEAGLNPAIIVWVPTMIIGLVIEIVAWIRKMDKEKAPLFTSHMIRFFATILGTGAALFILSPYLLQDGNPIPGIMMVALAAMFLIVAEYSVQVFYVAGFLNLILGVVFISANITNPVFNLFPGIIAGLFFFIAGIVARQMEKRKNG